MRVAGTRDVVVRLTFNTFHAIEDDVRHAVRLMARAPAFTALAVTMLALGTGANIAMFTVIDAVMLRSPFPDAQQLAILRVTDSDGRLTSLIPTEQFEALSAAPRTLAAVAALGPGSHLLTGSGDPRRPDFECVTASMFDVLGTRPLLGRTFTRDDDRSVAVPPIVLSFAFWQQLGRPALGSALRLNDTPVTVIGVMPRDFAGPHSRNDASGWLPLNITLSGGGLVGCRAGTGLNVFARVRPGLSLAHAEAALPGIALASLAEHTYDGLRTPFVVLVAAVGCVLLIACLNLGGLQLERALARRREIAMRVALGANRARIVRQTLIEHVLLAVIAAVAGVAVTWATLRGLVSLLPTNMPHLAEVEVNRRVLVAALAVAGIAGLLSSLMPMLQARARSPAQDLADGTRTATGRSRWTRALVITQIALSIVVLIGAGLMIQTFLILRPSDPGFEPRGKLTTLVRLPARPPSESARFFERLFDQLRAIPGVRSVSGSSYLPMMGVVSTTPVNFEGKTVTPFGAVITSEYLPQMKIGLVAGRTFTSSDTAQSPLVAIVNERLARQLRPDGRVIGERIVAAGPRRPGELPVERQIVGVIANTRSLGSHTRAAAEFYVPCASPISLLNVLVEADTPRLAIVSSELRRTIRTLDPQLVIEDIELLADMLNERFARPRLGAWLLGIFAAIALTLSAIGLMTTLGSWVSRRWRELGIRVALGASRVQLTHLVLRQGMTLAAGGIALGCLAAVGVTRYLEGWIYGVTALDRTTFVGAASLMLLIACGTISVPLRKALKVDPAVVLRAE